MYCDNNNINVKLFFFFLLELKQLLDCRGKTQLKQVTVFTSQKGTRRTATCSATSDSPQFFQAAW